MISILQNSTAVCPGVPCPFSGTGGVSPYTYAVLPDGAGGTINNSGVYTAPPGYGIDTIQVTDSLGKKATSQILVGSSIELVCDIIQNQMNLARGQVWLWNQKWNIPNDSKLYIAVGILSCKPFSNINDFSRGDGTTIQTTNFQTLLSLDIMSRGVQARDRKEEMLMALNSQYAESQMELNSFRIFQIPTGFVNLSQLDGAAIPYRFNVTIALQYSVSKTTPIAYYGTFNEQPAVSTNT